MLLDEVDQAAGEGDTSGGEGRCMDQQDGIGTVPCSSVSSALFVGLDIGIAADVEGRHASLPPRDSSTSAAMLARPRPLERMASRP